MRSLSSTKSKLPTQGLSRRLTGLAKITICLLLSLCWHSATTKAQTLTCLDSSPRCIEQLALEASANSPKLEALSKQIALINRRLRITNDRISSVSKKTWTNYITLDPFELLQNIAGGGGVRRDDLAIANMKVEKTNLRAQRENLERRRSEVKADLKEEIVDLVLAHETAMRQHFSLYGQLENIHVQQQIFEIDYRTGGGSPQQVQALLHERRRIEAQLVQHQLFFEKLRRKVLNLTGGFKAPEPEREGGEWGEGDLG